MNTPTLPGPRCRRHGSVASITTSRLVLRRWRDSDVAPMAVINADPEVMRWIGDGSVRTRQQTKAGIEAWERDWERWGFGLFALEVRTTGELAAATNRIGFLTLSDELSIGRDNHDRCTGLSASAPLPPGWFRDQAVVQPRDGGRGRRCIHAGGAVRLCGQLAR